MKAKAAQYQDIGHYLHDVRESLNVSLEQAAHDLHIRLQYLHAIEAGTLGEIPNKIYARGYIRNYAAYLQLPPQEVLEAYDALLQDHPMQFFIPEPTLKQNLPTGYVVQIAIGGLLLLYAYWYFAVHDHSASVSIAPDMPESFAQMLDKTPHPGAESIKDAAWKDCLQAGNMECFATLSSHTEPVLAKTLYELDLSKAQTISEAPKAPVTSEGNDSAADDDDNMDTPDDDSAPPKP